MKEIKIDCYEVISCKEIKHVAYFSTYELALEFVGNNPYQIIKNINTNYFICDNIKEAINYNNEIVKKSFL